MKIIVTNDDGISSPVLATLADALSLDHDVIVVAPSSDQSGMSQAFTHGLDRRLGYRRDSNRHYPSYEVHGTPCDCIKFAVGHLLDKSKIDLVISGINLGENAGISSIYSGTVAAAREGAMWGIPSLAVSVWKNEPDRLDHAVRWILHLLQRPSLLPTQPGGLWNVNFPPCPPDQIEGIEITAMSTVMFEDSYLPVVNAHGITEYQLTGFKPKDKFLPGTDDHALARNRISITPMQLDHSHGPEASRLRGLQDAWKSLSSVTVRHEEKP
jgi:5'-nucleotidase